jgi:23S rRNA (guanosine2251-2'-O)-methyltransferase
MEKLKEAGLWIAGADAGAKEGFYETNLTGPLAIVIGNEGQGLSRLVRERCDFILSLPMVGQINSLNASVAAGVILYEVVRQRQQALKKTGATQGQASSASDHA